MKPDLLFWETINLKSKTLLTGLLIRPTFFQCRQCNLKADTAIETTNVNIKINTLYKSKSKFLPYKPRKKKHHNEIQWSPPHKPHKVVISRCFSEIPSFGAAISLLSPFLFSYGFIKQLFKSQQYTILDKTETIYLPELVCQHCLPLSLDFGEV